MTLCFDDDIIGPWVASKTGGTWCKGRSSSIGKIVDGKIVAGVLYEDFNGANIMCHIAGEGAWACRKYLNIIFDYPFNQLKVKRITVPVASTNAKSIGLVEKMGFIIDAKLAQATPDGDLLVYRLFRDECKYIKGNYGKSKSSETA